LRMIANLIRRPSRFRSLRRTTFRALRTRTDRRGKGDRDLFDRIGLLHKPIELCPQFAVRRKVSTATGDGPLRRKQAAREEREQRPHDCMRSNLSPSERHLREPTESERRGDEFTLSSGPTVGKRNVGTDFSLCAGYRGPFICWKRTCDRGQSASPRGAS
jgi:hypothetical protein